MICIEDLARSVRMNEIFEVYVKRTKDRFLGFKGTRKKRNNKRR